MELWKFFKTCEGMFGKKMSRNSEETTREISGGLKYREEF